MQAAYSRRIWHTLRLYFTQHIHTLIAGILTVIEVSAKHSAATGICRSTKTAGHKIKLPVSSLILRLENSRIDGNDFAVDVVLIVVGDTVYLSDNRNGNIQLFNLFPKPLGVLLDALCKEQRCINVVVTNSTLGEFFEYVVAFSVAAEEAFSIAILLILGKDDFTGADIHGTQDGVIAHHTLFTFHNRHLK